MKQKNVKIEKNIRAVCTRFRDKYDEYFDVFEPFDLNIDNTEPDIETLNEYLEAAEKSDDVDKIIDLQKYIKMRNITWNAQTYHTMIFYNFKKENYDAAIDLYIEMKQNDIIPRKNTYGVCISLCVKNNRNDILADLMCELKQKNIFLTEKVQTMCVATCVEHNEYNIVFDMMEILIKRDDTCDIITINAYIFTCIAREKYHYVFRLFNFVKKHNIMPNATFHNYIIETYLLLHLTNHAIDYFKENIDIKKERCIDLHGHTWSVAHIILLFMLPERKPFTLITGYGSTSGKHTIRDYVQKYLNDANIPWKFSDKTLGRIKIFYE